MLMHKAILAVCVTALLFVHPAWAESPLKVQQLQQRLTATAIENPGDYGIAAVDLETGTVVSVNGSMTFPMASTMKIAVAAAYLTEVDAAAAHSTRSLPGRRRSAS
jgi:beta-lactamase class A